MEGKNVKERETGILGTGGGRSIRERRRRRGREKIFDDGEGRMKNTPK